MRHNQSFFTKIFIEVVFYMMLSNSAHSDSNHRNGVYYLADEAAMLDFGNNFAPFLQIGLIVTLIGNLGAGKTTLVRGILHGLGYQGIVKSPTYNLVEIYKISRLYLYHFDFYRFADFHEWEEAGFREYFNSTSICFVEWPEKTGNLLPSADLEFSIEILEAGRNITIKTGTDAGKRCLEHWRNQKKT